MGLGAVIQGLGAGVNSYQGELSARRQSDNAKAGIGKQRQIERDINSGVNNAVSGLSKSTPSAERENAASGYLRALRSNRVGAVERPQFGSSRYRSGAAEAGRGVGDYASQVAQLLARINAPELQRQREAEGMARLSADISAARRNSEAEQYLTALRSGAIPGQTGAGELISGVGSAISSRQGAKKPTNSGISGPRE